MSRAIRVVDYFKAHARVVYARLRHTPEDNRLLEVLEWIRQRGGQCRARDLANAKKVTPTSKAKLMLNEMEERGYGRVEPRLASNGKKVLWFVLDPG